MENTDKDRWMLVQPSCTALSTFNPLRKLVDKLKIQPPPDREYISLALGKSVLFAMFTVLFDQAIRPYSKISKRIKK
jgi:hypothetical protein